MILEIDMGNTRIKWRVRNELATLAQGHLLTGNNYSSFEREIEPFLYQLTRVQVASVVGPELETQFSDWFLSHSGLVVEFASSNTVCGFVQNGYEEPEKLGVDRWLAIVASFHFARKACVVMSCGTAITVDAVTSDGKHLGGYIAPGLQLMIAALNQGTRLIFVDNFSGDASLLPGKTTQDAVNSACMAMLLGLVENGVSQLRNAGEVGDIEIFITGGDAGKIKSVLLEARLLPDLVLDGLAYAFK